MTTVSQHIADVWSAIEKSGSIDNYVSAQMREHGFLVKRQDTANMSKRELANYKKELKKEAAEKKRLNRQAWQAYRSNNIVHLGENIYWNDSNDWDKWDLSNAEECLAENELPPLNDAKDLAEALGLSVGELRWLSYHREAATRIHYHRFTIPKRDGSERAIWAPLPKLKAAQHWILDNILGNLLVHGDAHGFVPGRSILSNAQAHTNAKLVVKLDLENFFPTITLQRVKGVFRKAGFRERVATLLALLCTESPREIVSDEGQKYFIALGSRCLPQGAPTSPAITNALCLRMDRRLSGLAAKFGYRYTRYADDLTFSLENTSKQKAQLGNLLRAVKDIVVEEGFAINTKKTRILRKGSRQKVTGLVVNGDEGVRVPRKTKRQYRAAIHNYLAGKPLREGESWHTLYGYAAFVFMTDQALGLKMMQALNKAKPAS